jgi:hypothetical protein
MAEKIKNTNFAISTVFRGKHIERCTFISGYQNVIQSNHTYTRFSKIKSGQNYIHIT